MNRICGIITSLEEAAFNFQFFDSQLCFIGHTHIPLIIVLDKNNELYVHQIHRYVFMMLRGLVC